MPAPQVLMEQYRSAFVRADVSGLLDCFAFPLQVISVTDGEASGSVASVEEWSGVLSKLLGAYRRLGVTDCVPLSVDVTEAMDAVAVIRVHWSLQRPGREPVYEFSAMYTLARTAGQLRIVALAHNEVPRMRAALSRP